MIEPKMKLIWQRGLNMCMKVMVSGIDGSCCSTHGIIELGAGDG